MRPNREIEPRSDSIGTEKALEMGMSESAIETSCHCGAIRLVIDSAPEAVTDCNCSICRRYGVLWAYYSPKQVHFTPQDPITDIYLWGNRGIEFHRCRQCGCLTHWAAVDKTRDRLGVNARLMAPEILAEARIRRLDGAVTDEYFDE
jgi:hypothetical protein